MDAQDDTKLAERAIPTKFERREWFLENLRFLLSLDLNEDSSDDDSRSELLRLHLMESTVSVCTSVSIPQPPTVCLSFFRVDK